MKKLLYIANLRFPTEKAYGIQIAKMCEAFAAEGADITLIYPFRGTDIKEDFHSYYSVNKNFKIKMLWAPDFYFPGKLDKISVNIKNFISGLLLSFYALNNKADIIYSRDEWPVYFLSFLRKNVFFEAHKFSDARKFFYRNFLKRNIKIITISESLKNKFLNLGFPSGNVLVAHDGVDLDIFDIPVSKKEAREKVGLPENGDLIMYTGHLFEWKGADVLALAAKLIPEAKFVFVGGTEYDINSFKNKFGNIPNILIIGHKPHKDIPLFLKAADVLILPNSGKEEISSLTSPLKLFEYMASGRPIVASSLPSISEILYSHNSILVKPDDPGKLAEGIKAVLDQQDRGQSLASNASENVKEYTWRKRVQKILSFVQMPA